MFYAIDSRRVTLEEYRWGTPALMMPLVVLLKLLRVRLPSSTDDPNVESLTPFEIDPDGLPAAERESLRPVEAEFARLGFIDPIYHRILDPLNATRIETVSFRHPSGVAVARLFCRLWSHTHPPKERRYTTFLSALDDGSFLCSTAGRPDLAAPANCVVNRQVDAAPEALWRSHRDALLKSGREAELVPDADSTRALLERHHAALRDFHLGRGVFAPLDERARTQQQQAAAVSAETGSRFPDELAEIDKLQSGKTSWRAALVLLLVTVALFVLLGAASWSLEWTLLLLPILFFHEAGHYVAMRVFRYRNVRMFFLPLFGAAVVGRNHGAPGWKRAVVALAGPLPGIAAGLGLGAAALALESAGVARAALMMIILNGFNLLPFLPLDGGWTLQAVLFNRHYLLDAGFRALAVLGLLGLAVLFGDKLLGYLAIPMAIGVMPAWRNGRIAHELAQQGDPAPVPDDGNLPVPVLDAIIERVKAAYPKGQTRKTVAQHALDIADKLYAQPPGGLATLGILALYAGSIAAAVIGAAVVTALQP